MIINYEFNGKLIGRDEEYNEEYYETIDYNYELSAEDMTKIATKMIMEDAECDKQTADKFVVSVLWQYDFMEEYLEKNIDYVKEYFSDKAEREFMETLED